MTSHYKGERVEEGFGWLSEGRTLKKAIKKLDELKEAAKDPSFKNPDGTPKPTRISEARQAEKERRENEALEKARLENENLTFGQFFTETYFPISKISKRPESWKKEEQHFRLYLEPVLGEKPLKDIKPLTVERVKKTILDAKRSPRFLQFGHSTVQMSARYAHLGPGAMQEAVKRLPSLTTGEHTGQEKVIRIK